MTLITTLCLDNYTQAYTAMIRRPKQTIESSAEQKCAKCVIKAKITFRAVTINTVDNRLASLAANRPEPWPDWLY